MKLKEKFIQELEVIVANNIATCIEVTEDGIKIKNDFLKLKSLISNKINEHTEMLSYYTQFQEKLNNL